MKTNARTRNKVVRMLLASLLQSNLSESELLEVSESLAHDPEMMFQLGRFLRLYTEETRNREPEPEISPSTFSNPEFQALLLVIKRRRMAKRQLLSLIESISPHARPSERLADLPTGELLAWFYERATDAEKDRLSAYFHELKGPDPYLEGIMKRGEKDRHGK